jgi:hypothetical protein
MSLQNVDASRRCQAAHQDACIGLELNIMVNSTSISWQRVCLPLKSYIVDVDDQAVV